MLRICTSEQDLRRDASRQIKENFDVTTVAEKPIPHSDKADTTHVSEDKAD